MSSCAGCFMNLIVCSISSCSEMWSRILPKSLIIFTQSMVGSMTDIDCRQLYSCCNRERLIVVCDQFLFYFFGLR